MIPCITPKNHPGINVTKEVKKYSESLKALKKTEEYRSTATRLMCMD